MRYVRDLRKDKLRIFFFIPDLNAGGAERVLVNIVNHVNRDRFTPFLLLFRKIGPLLSQVSGDVQICDLQHLHEKICRGFEWLDLVIRFIKYARQSRPDAVVSFMWYPNAIALAANSIGGLNLKIIATEHTSSATYKGKMIGLLRRLLIRALYPKANMIVAPSQGIADDLYLRYGISKKKLKVIHNPLDTNVILKKAGEPLEHPWYGKGESIIIAIGRLGQEKGFSFLIRAVAHLAREGTRCKLIILGEGTEKENLQRLVKELSLEDAVSLPGFQENPYKYLSRSTVFVLSSLYEGFPNVLLEALALGVPSIATRCPTGPEEIIIDGVSGILVEPASEEAMADAIKRVLSDAELRKKLAEGGRKRAEDFSVEKIIKEYEAAIDEVCAESAER